MLSERQIRGKKSRNDGMIFERKVREDLCKKGWIVSKWQNNVEVDKFCDKECKNIGSAHLIPAKRKYNPFTKRPMAEGTGFPDFIIFPKCGFSYDISDYSINYRKKYDSGQTEVIGVEVKSNGYLDKEEKEKCKWLLENKIFSKILIAKKIEKGGIEYKEFKCD